MTFGRFSGKKFGETPTSYRDWAVREVSSHDNPSEELILFANWWQAELVRTDQEKSEGPPSSSTWRPNYVDPEATARIPYVEDGTSTASWDEVSVHTSPDTVQGATGGNSGPGTRQDQDVPEEVIDEVLDLEARLAAPRDLHGIAPRSWD